MSHSAAFYTIGLAALLQAPGLMAETVTLKNGTILHGSISQMNDVDLTIETADLGQVVVKRRAVKSIQDGPQTADAPGAPSVMTPSQNVNVTTNGVAHQDATTTPAAAAVVVYENVSDSGSSLLGGSLSIGYASVGSALYGPSGSFHAPVVIWSLIGYRAPSSLFVNFQAETSSERHHDNETIWARGAFGVGYASAPPAPHHAGSMAQFYGTLGYAQLQSKFLYPDYGSGGNRYQNFENYSMKNVTITDSGIAYGIATAYNYYFSGGLGLHAGAAIARGEMNNSKTSGLDTAYFSSGYQVVNIGYADIGIAYRF